MKLPCTIQDNPSPKAQHLSSFFTNALQLWTLDCISPSIHEHWGKFTLFSLHTTFSNPSKAWGRKTSLHRQAHHKLQTSKLKVGSIWIVTPHIPFINKQYLKLNCHTFLWPATLPDTDYICWVICWVLDPMLGLLACCIVLPLKLSQVTSSYKKRRAGPPSKRNESTFNY
jgi:hypothetical protein